MYNNRSSVISVLFSFLLRSYPFIYFVSLRNGGICFYKCQRISVIKNASFGYLAKDNEVRRDCLWVITHSNASNHEILLNGTGFSNETTITLTTTYLKLSCVDSHIYVYDGIPGREKTRFIGSICGQDAKVAKPLEAKSGVMTVQYQGLITGKAFHLHFRIHQCSFSCTGNRHCAQDTDGTTRCICKPGWMGVDCKEETCPANCSSASGRGYCNKVKVYWFLIALS